MILFCLLMTIASDHNATWNPGGVTLQSMAHKDMHEEAKGILQNTHCLILQGARVCEGSSAPAEASLARYYLQNIV